MFHLQALFPVHLGHTETPPAERKEGGREGGRGGREGGRKRREGGREEEEGGREGVNASHSQNLVAKTTGLVLQGCIAVSHTSTQGKQQEVLCSRDKAVPINKFYQQKNTQHLEELRIKYNEQQ